MKSKQNYVFLFILLISKFLMAQSAEKYTLVFQPVYGNEKLELGKKYGTANNKDSVQIDLLRFYISGVEFLKNGEISWKEENSFHLIDATVEKSMQQVIENVANKEFSEVRFTLGIDSVTNVSGAMGGDLDPTKGMYWTWQSGYINFKIEGESSLSTSKGREFQYHLGGYQFPFATCQKILVKSTNNESVTIKIDVEKIIAAMDISQLTHIMSPGREAVLLSEKVAKQFNVH